MQEGALASHLCLRWTHGTWPPASEPHGAMASQVSHWYPRSRNFLFPTASSPTSFTFPRPRPPLSVLQLHRNALPCISSISMQCILDYPSEAPWTTPSPPGASWWEGSPYQVVWGRQNGI